MKTILFSRFTKTIAVIAFIVCVAVLAYQSGGFVTEIADSNQPFIYSFEEKFNDIRYLLPAQMSPHNAVFDTFYDTYFDTSGLTDFDSLLKKRMDNSYWSSKIYYRIEINSKVFSNCSLEPSAFFDYEFYSYIQRDANGDSFIDISQSNLSSHWNLYYSDTDYYGADGSEIKIYTAVIPSFAKECKIIWEIQRRNVLDTIINSSLLLLGAFISFIYLISVCGRNKNGERVSLWIDNVWTEIHLVFLALSSLGAIALAVMLLDAYPYGYFTSEIICTLIAALAVGGGAIFLLSGLSLIRKIKFRTFAKESFIIRFTIFCSRLIFKAIEIAYRFTAGCTHRGYKYLSKSFTTLFRMISVKSALIMLSLFTVYTVSICLMSIGIIISGFWVLTVVILFCLGCFFLAYRAKDIDIIKNGVKQIQKGNLSYKINNVKSDDLKQLAISVNGIAKGLDESVTAKLKAERLKTELITNVSHDIKTPLTSIINYTVLLSQVEGLPEEARDYVSIISDKAIRLKNLTVDLFDISKVQSGNEIPSLERLDLSLLVQQSVAEYDNEIRASALNFCYDLSKGICIIADGRKMSRVINNLLSNVLKYSMNNTRVFISTSVKNGKATLEIKNIASYPMNFDVEEISGRFVRGDESRTSEGYGLGLAIAKSYTELCGGSFKIMTDGDLFKAILEFDAVG